MLPKLQYENQLLTAIEIAKSIARDNRHGVYTGSHLLTALLHEDVELAPILEEWGIDVFYVKDWAAYRISDLPKSMAISDDMPAHESIKKLMEFADVVRLKIGEKKITPLATLIAICRPDVVYSEDELRSLNTTESELTNFALQQAGSLSASAVAMGNQASGGASSTLITRPNLSTLAKFCVDKTALARDGRLDPIVGRDGEIRQMVETLSRRTKPNVLLVGEPGVGKTALVEGFALNIINNEVTGNLKSATVLELDVGALVAGASYKGEFEDRLKKVIKEVKLIERAILFIDEIHVLLDPKSSVGNGAVNLLKPELARGAITVIGATTHEEYRLYIEKDEAFNRRFERLRIEEPNEETAIRMLKAILPKYTEHHKLQVAEEAISQCVGLASRFLRDRSLPDSAVDLLDRTMAAIRLLQDGSNEVIDAFSKELKNLENSNIAQSPSVYFRELKWFEGQMNHRLSPILMSGIEEDVKEEKTFSHPEEFSRHLEEKLNKVKKLAEIKIEAVEAGHIASIVSYKTGIPTGKIQSKEREKLLNIEDILGKRVIGQDHAISIVSNAIRVGRAGMNDPDKPIASFFFLGPTGTGKTELTKAIAELLFNDADAIIRFDMSEFKAEYATSALLGSEPGLVGYEKGGPLINKIRQQPYAVVLFDEIEKANKEIFDIFLKILDEGKAKDKLEKEGDFSKAIIIFTSNIGHKYIADNFNENKIPQRQDMEQIMKQYFRPEFLGRLDGLVPFSPLTEASMLKIFEIHFRKLKKRAEEVGIHIQMSETAKAHVAKAGFSPEFGARPLIREIKLQLSQPLSERIIKGEVKAGDTLQVDVNDEGHLQWSVEKLL